MTRGVASPRRCPCPRRGASGHVGVLRFIGPRRRKQIYRTGRPVPLGFAPAAAAVVLVDQPRIDCTEADEVLTGERRTPGLDHAAV